MIKVFIKHPERLGYTAVIKNELKEMQELVGGYIETVMFTDNLIIVCNEERRLIPLPKNMMGLHGTFFIVGTEGDEFRSLTDEELMACEFLINGDEFLINGGEA